MNSFNCIFRLSLILGLGLTSLPLAKAQHQGNSESIPFYPSPVNARKDWLIQNFGPVGIGITIGKKDKLMRIKNVEKGSPADQVGKLAPKQVIKSINGIDMSGRDPRPILGDIITKAEATDGRVALNIEGLGTVTVTIPTFGRYSDTWPLKCPKSEKIVRNFADLLAEQAKGEDWGAMLFLLSTGEEKDLQVVREWIKDVKSFANMNWSVGYQGIAFCEYYLRTGDASVLPAIQEGADKLRDSIYNGAWSGRKALFTYQGGGTLNAAGVHCLTFLLLAQTCGVEVDEATLQSSLRYFYRFVGRGSVPYGDFTPKTGYGDCNGKTGGLAMAMMAASRLTPNGEKSVYHQAAEVSSMKSYYGINIYGTGHTGGGIGEIWKSASMGLMKDSRPSQYRQYMDARRWILELSRRHNGSIGIAGGSDNNYDKAQGEKKIPWGNLFALNYTAPRKHLYMFGAESQWAKQHQLPARPWGSAEDDVFCSPYPSAAGPWSRDDILKETIHEHVGEPVYKLLGQDNVSDQTIITYLHHPEITHRAEAMKTVLRLQKDDMVLELLRSRDARLRQTGIMALHELLGTWRRTFKAPERVTEAMWNEVDRMLRNPNESWSVKQWALGILRHAEIDRLRAYRDLLAELVEHKSSWIHGSAITTSIPLLMDQECYRVLFPPVARTLSKTTSYPVISRAHEITAQLGNASPEIQSFGLEIMKKIYSDQPQELVSERGIYVIPGGGAVKRKAIGQAVGFSQAGRDFLNSQTKLTSAWKVSGDPRDLYTFDGKFKGNPLFTGHWGLVAHNFVENRAQAEKLITSRIESNKLPPIQKKYKGYGFKVSQDGGIQPIGLIIQNLTFPMQYSGNTAFSSFVDKAYHFEVFTLGGRDFLMFEMDFEPEHDPAHKKQYKTFVKVSP